MSMKACASVLDLIRLCVSNHWIFFSKMYYMLYAKYYYPLQTVPCLVIVKVLMVSGLRQPYVATLIRAG